MTTGNLLSWRCPSLSVRRVGGATQGFSLVELLVVIAIMTLLASIGMPLAELSSQRAKEADLRRSLREIRNALDAYKQLVDQGRISQPAGWPGYPPSLQALVDGVQDATSPQGRKLYVMRSLPRDPFAPEGMPAADTWATRSYTSPPDQPQAGTDVYDVHSRSAATGLNGMAYASW